jgi:hypothetical protein
LFNIKVLDSEGIALSSLSRLYKIFKTNTKPGFYFSHHDTSPLPTAAAHFPAIPTSVLQFSPFALAAYQQQQNASRPGGCNPIGNLPMPWLNPWLFYGGPNMLNPLSSNGVESVPGSGNRTPHRDGSGRLQFLLVSKRID